MLDLSNKIQSAGYRFPENSIECRSLVELFLSQKIGFTDIQKKLFQIIKMKEFVKYKKIYPLKIKDIIDLNDYVRLKTIKKVYKTLNIHETY